MEHQRCIFMQRKGQGLSMNTIVIAAIALLVLVVVAVIFMQQMGVFNVKSKECSSLGGECHTGSCMEDYVPSPNGVCYDGAGEKDPLLVCCNPLG